jgi:O-antigen/teichoic acid export membrane protein
MTNKKSIFIKLVSGSALSQIIVILAMPLLTRMYSPNEFGYLAIVNAFLMVLGVVGSLRYDQLIYKYNTKYEWSRCFNNGLVSSLIIFTILLFIFVLCYFFGFLHRYFLITPFLVLAFSITQLYSSLLSVYGLYTTLGYGLITRSLIMILSQYFLNTYLGGFALIIGLFLGQISHLLVLSWVFTLKSNDRMIDLKVDFYDFKDSILSTGQSLSNSFSSQLPSFFIPYGFGLTVMGIYSLAQRLTFLPITFFSNAIRPFILGELNNNRADKQKVGRLLQKGSMSLLIIGCFGILLINLFAEEFFVLYAGEEWRAAGDTASALSFWVMCAFSNIIATSYLTVHAYFRQLFIYDVTLLIVRVIVTVYSYIYHVSFIEFIYLYSFTGLVFNLFIIFYAIALGKKDAKSIISHNA